MAPVVRGKIRHTFEMRVQIGSQVNATGRALATMEEWVRVVLVKVVTDWAPPMRKDVVNVYLSKKKKARNLKFLAFLSAAW